MLLVQKLHPDAKLPTVAHPGEDLGYDLYALEDVHLTPRVATKVRTGIAVRAAGPFAVPSDTSLPFGLLIRDRSSMAGKGLVVSGGVIDAGYTGEIVVMLTFLGFGVYDIHAGDKIAQMIPIPVWTDEVIAVDELPQMARGAAGFGSSGN